MKIALFYIMTLLTVAAIMCTGPPGNSTDDCVQAKAKASHPLNAAKASHPLNAAKASHPLNADRATASYPLNAGGKSISVECGTKY